MMLRNMVNTINYEVLFVICIWPIYSIYVNRFGAYNQVDKLKQSKSYYQLNSPIDLIA